MTGLEHYREAERLVDIAYRSEEPFASVTALCAQVHATLALASGSAITAWDADR